MTNTIKPVRLAEIQNPHLNAIQTVALVLAMNTAIRDEIAVHVSLTYPKQTDSKPSIAGVDYVKLPGVSPYAQIGTLTVDRYVDNRENRKLERVRKPYIRVNSVTRGDGLNPRRPRSIRPNGITEFAVTGLLPKAEVVDGA